MALQVQADPNAYNEAIEALKDLLVYVINSQTNVGAFVAFGSLVVHMQDGYAVHVDITDKRRVSKRQRSSTSESAAADRINTEAPASE